MDLSKYIGKASTYDKKLRLDAKNPESWLKSVSAFANTNGGALIFGISDDDVLVGLDTCQKDSELIGEIVKNRIEPRPYISIDVFSEEGKDFIVVYVPWGEDTPYYLIEGDSKTAYVRMEDESLPATRYDLKRLVLQGIKQSYDTMMNNTQKAFTNFQLLGAKYYSCTGKRFKDKDLYSFGLMSQSNLLTNAGALVTDQETIYHSKIICSRWKGLDKTSEPPKSLYYREFNGSLVSLLDGAIGFIKVHTKNMWKKGAKNGAKYPDYSEIAVTEAIVNALVHRDYFITEEVIHIDIYNDRLEVSSPGGMVDRSLVQKKDLDNIPSYRRNPVIADLFGRMNLMERSGNGLKKIIESYESKENYTEDMKPRFISTDSDFRVVLYNLNYKG